jgi:hypothetical protein
MQRSYTHTQMISIVSIVITREIFIISVLLIKYNRMILYIYEYKNALLKC